MVREEYWGGTLSKSKFHVGKKGPKVAWKEAEEKWSEEGTGHKIQEQ